MKLPNLAQAIIPESKLTSYILSTSHPFGRHKAAFFARFGFTGDSWQILAVALLKHAEDHEVATTADTPFGTRYTVEGSPASHDGRNPSVRVVWFVIKEEEVPRLVTVYPAGSARDD